LTYSITKPTPYDFSDKATLLSNSHGTVLHVSALAMGSIWVWFPWCKLKCHGCFFSICPLIPCLLHVFKCNKALTLLVPLILFLNCHNTQRN